MARPRPLSGYSARSQLRIGRFARRIGASVEEVLADPQLLRAAKGQARPRPIWKIFTHPEAHSYFIENNRELVDNLARSDQGRATIEAQIRSRQDWLSDHRPTQVSAARMPIEFVEPGEEGHYALHSSSLEELAERMSTTPGAVDLLADYVAIGMLHNPWAVWFFENT